MNHLNRIRKQSLCELEEDRSLSMKRPITAFISNPFVLPSQPEIRLPKHIGDEIKGDKKAICIKHK
jgi:hypothetical protein